MYKKIHFYESVHVCPVGPSIYLDWYRTNEAIENKEPEIHTMQMCLLSVTLLHKGYRMYVHQHNGFSYEITLKSRGGTGDRSVRDAQNVYAMWASNIFREDLEVKKYEGI